MLCRPSTASAQRKIAIQGVPSVSNQIRRLTTCLFALCASLTATAQNRIAIPSYQDPGSSQWNAWIAPGRASVGLMIVNEDNGDDLTYYPSVDAGIQAARKKGVFVVGYVYTGYGQRDLAAVEADIAGVYKNYSVDGIFFDEAPTDCKAASITGASTYAYYQQLADYVRSHQAGARLVVLNPGTQPANDCWMSLANILVTSEEDNLKDYKAGYQDQAWFHRYAPDRFWHIVYNIDNATDFASVLALSRQRGAGWVYITDGNSSNPYLKPPAYWPLETQTIAGEEVQAPYATYRPNATDENGDPVPARFSIRWQSSEDTAWYIFLDSSIKSPHPVQHHRLRPEHRAGLPAESCEERDRDTLRIFRQRNVVQVDRGQRRGRHPPHRQRLRSSGSQHGRPRRSRVPPLSNPVGSRRPAKPARASQPEQHQLRIRC